MKKYFPLIYLTGLLLFLFFTPRFILYSDFKIVGWIIYALIFGLLPFLVFITVSSYKYVNKYGIIIACLSVLIVGPAFGIVHQYKETLELEKYGVWTKVAVVNRKFINWKNHRGWVIKGSYSLENKLYVTNFENDDENKYYIGDSLRLIYSSEFPKIYKLGYEWKQK
jgi:hypothetical protein